jgi:hypothetical protein
MDLSSPISQSETVRQSATIIKSSDANFSVIRSRMAGSVFPDAVVTPGWSENRDIFFGCDILSLAH